jgi:predicted RNA-binding Zn ribbon-like protein
VAPKLNTAKFELVGGSPSVDFVNTVVGWDGGPAREGARDYRDIPRSDKLEGYADLVAWGWHTGLLDDEEAGRLLRLAADRPREAEKVFRRALGLRASLYRLFRSAVEGWEPEAADVETLNRELAVANKHGSLAYGRDGFGWEWDDRSGALDSVLWQVASGAAELLASGDLSKLRQCGGAGCGWMFLDTSRNRSRRWCDMKDCGNRAKVRRFRQRQLAAR